MIKLGVNIDHIATLREARKEGIPDIILAAKSVLAGAADGLTIHLRQDRRHIQDDDVHRLKKAALLPINLEMAAVEEIVNIALKVLPKTVCLVPEKREELTTEGGLNVCTQIKKLKETTAELQIKGIEVSLFIDPNLKDIDAALKIEADAIELHTGSYANAVGIQKELELAKIKKAAEYALKNGLKVNAGHGLDYENVFAIKRIEGISDLNIGYSIICRAVFVGLETAVREMKKLIE